MEDVMMDWRTAFRSVAGTSHSRQSPPRPCEDCSTIERLPDGGLAILVSDGMGSAAFGGEGAAIAIDASATFIRDHDGMDEAFARACLEAIVVALRAEAAKRSALPRAFACTFVAAIVRKGKTLLIHVGDGGIVFADRGGRLTLPSPPQKGEYANMTPSMTGSPLSPLIRVFDEVPAAIAVFSDGLENVGLQRQMRTWTPLGSFFDKLFRGVATAKERHEQINQDLERLLASAEINERTDDDKTLALAVDRARYPLPADEAAPKSGAGVPPPSSRADGGGRGRIPEPGAGVPLWGEGREHPESPRSNPVMEPSSRSKAKIYPEGEGREHPESSRSNPVTEPSRGKPKISPKGEGREHPESPRLNPDVEPSSRSKPKQGKPAHPGQKRPDKQSKQYDPVVGILVLVLIAVVVAIIVQLWSVLLSQSQSSGEYQSPLTYQGQPDQHQSQPDQLQGQPDQLQSQIDQLRDQINQHQSQIDQHQSQINRLQDWIGQQQKAEPQGKATPKARSTPKAKPKPPPATPLPNQPPPQPTTPSTNP
jgi:hypothetical protein